MKVELRITMSYLRAAAKPVLTICLIAAMVTPAAAVVFSNTNPITINDATSAAGRGNPYPSTITVSGLTGTTTEVVAKLENLNHTFSDDINILLVAPTGQNILLMSDVGGSNDLMFTNITFADSGAATIPDSGSFPSGTYKPSNVDSTTENFPAPAPAPSANTTMAAAFNGFDPNGTWSLFVLDDAGADVGSLGNGWSLTITTTGSPATTFTNYGEIFINDGFNKATPYPSTINVSGLTGTITDINVTLNNVNHPNPDDIDVLLIGPTGKRLLIMSDAGGTTDLVGVNITLDDEAAAPLPDSTVIATGTYNPRNFGTGDNIADNIPVMPGAATGGTATLASVFDGTEPNGTWSLEVVDDVNANAGSIMGGWSIDIVAGGTRSTKSFTSADFDGDGRTDHGVYRPSDNFWYMRDSRDLSVQYMKFGLAGDIPVPRDYDGDVKTDIAVFRPSTGQWIVLNSGTSTVTFTSWGISTDIPVPADYDNDGKEDLTVWRPSEGRWYIRQSLTGTLRVVNWGVNGDIPIAGFLVGDLVDFVVFRPSEANWYVLDNLGSLTAVVQFGLATDELVPADYTGDGSTDFAVFRPSDGNWYVLTGPGTMTVTHWGQMGDIAAPGDYDGDSRTDVAVWRPSTGTRYVLNSGTIFGAAATRIDNWGTTGDVPLASFYFPPQ